MQTTFDNIHIDFLIPSPTNPRKTFDTKGWPEFVANIRTHGIMTPILVRPWNLTEDKSQTSDCYEIIAGERRYRAAQEADIKDVPSMICNISDQQVLELQMVENLQREDLLPLEEATSYRTMIDQYGYTVDELVAKINRSRSYIYGRLKLLDLTPEARKMIEGGSVEASIAELVARLPGEKLQTKALNEILKQDHNGEPMSFRRAKLYLQDRYTLKLSTALFSTTDPTLDLIAGSCTDCPKRSGNATDLYPDIDNPNVCTDPDCFAHKKALHDQQQAMADKNAEESAKESKPAEAPEENSDTTIFGYDYGRDPSTQAKPEPVAETPKPKQTAAQKKAEEKKKQAAIVAQNIEAKTELRVIEAIRSKISLDLANGIAITIEDLHLIAQHTFSRLFYQDQLHYGSVWGLPISVEKYDEDIFFEHIAGMNSNDVVLFLIDAALRMFGFEAAAQRHQINIEKIRREVIRELSPASKSKSTHTPKPAAQAKKQKAPSPEKPEQQWPFGEPEQETKKSETPAARAKKPKPQKVQAAPAKKKPKQAKPMNSDGSAVESKETPPSAKAERCDKTLDIFEGAEVDGAGREAC